MAKAHKAQGKKPASVRIKAQKKHSINAKLAILELILLALIAALLLSGYIVVDG